MTPDKRREEKDNPRDGHAVPFALRDVQVFVLTYFRLHRNQHDLGLGRVRIRVRVRARVRVGG